jgi:GNAT superfamily N-acetyltransferase
MQDARTMMTALTYEKDGYRLTDDSDDFDLDTAHHLLTHSYWSPGVPRETVREAVHNSWTFSLLAPDGRFAGMARFVTDYASFAYLADVIIDDTHRGQGLGVWMMDVLHQLPQIRACRRVMLMTADAHGLYEKYGYQALAAPDRAMELHRPDIYQDSMPIKPDRDGS